MSEQSKPQIIPMENFPDSLHGHRFSASERQKLSRGEKVFIENMQFSGQTLRDIADFGYDMMGSLNDLLRGTGVALNQSGKFNPAQYVGPGDLRDGYLWLQKNEHGKTELHYQFKAQELKIEDKILDHKLSKEEKEELQKGRVVGPLKLKPDFNAFLQVDQKLGRVVIRTHQELAIPKTVGEYSLTPADQHRLANNEPMQPRVFKGDKGYFIANFKLTDDRKGHEYSNIKDLSTTSPSEIKKLIAELNKDSKEIIENVVSVTTKTIASEIDKKDKYQALDEAIKKKDFNEISRLGSLHTYEPDKVNELVEKNKLTREESTAVNHLTKTEKDDSKQFRSALKEGRYNDLEKILDNGYKPSPEEKISFKKTTDILSKEQRTELNIDRLSSKVLETEIKMTSSKEKQHNRGIGH